MLKLEHQFIKEELLLRDYLASERTMMSVDRTFLSYVRTALTFFIAGISMLKFFNTLFIHIIGWMFIPVALLTFLLGVYRTIQMAEIINNRAKKDGFKVDFPQSIVRQLLYNLTIQLKTGLKQFVHFIFPLTNKTSDKKIKA